MDTRTTAQARLPWTVRLVVLTIGLSALLFPAGGPAMAAGKPDLTVTLAAPTQVPWPPVFSYTLTLQNAGTAPADFCNSRGACPLVETTVPAGFTIQAWLGPSTPPRGLSGFACEHTTTNVRCWAQSIAPGVAVSIAVIVFAPTTTASGQYVIEARADPANVVTESSERSNVALVTITAP
jgi:hypothetical protein